MATFTTNDPLYASQWYLKNTGQRYAPGDAKPAVLLDINIESVWSKGINGSGVIIGVADDGIDLNHPDLQASLLKNLTYNSVNKAVGATAYNASGIYAPTADQHSHGTVVGSIATATGNNAEGIVGVAFGAKLVSTMVIHTPNPAVNYETVGMFTHLLNSKVGVSINSYGKDPAFSENYFITPGTPDANLTEDQKIFKEMQAAATTGRNGLGMVIEVSAGNEGANKADAGMTGFTNNRFTIATGAMNELGNATQYTSPGASVLLSAFGGVAADGAGAGDNVGFGILSADVSGAAGDNKAAGAAGNYSFQNQGTSYAGPIVGATAALMLQANPNLGFRDVSTILAMTARGVGENDYVNNAASDWNLGGMHFSRTVGFGLVDVAAAVQLAQSWTQAAGTAANWRSAQGVATIAGGMQDIAQDANGTTVTVNIASNVRIERMEFDLKITSNAPSELRAEITSAQGTKIVLFDQPLTKEVQNGQIVGTTETAWPGTFQIGSTAFLGENSAGTWTLKLFDVVTNEEVSTVEALTVRAWGSDITNDSQYIFTEEFKSTGRSITNDTLGTDTVNAAATHSRAVIDLSGVTASKVGAAATAFTITGSTIENAIGGAGNDLITGTATANVLRGNYGADVLVALAGVDQAFGGNDNDYLYMGDGNDTGYGDAGVDVLLGEGGLDTLYGGADTDYLFGGAGNDTLFGEGGVDVLNGEAGDDIFDGGDGGDYFYGGAGNDFGYGRDGNDIFVMDADNDTAFGEGGNDYFYMGAGNDTANGGAGVDVFLGGDGNDVFEGGTGVDYAWGEAGNDAFIIRGGSGVLVVNGFVAGGTDDVLRLTADTGITTFARAQSASTYFAGLNTTIVTVDSDTSVWLVGVNSTQLTAADFAFI